MMYRGYLKLWRKTEESGLFHMPETFTLFSFLLIKATHKPRKIGTPHGVVSLEAGQYVSGRLELASALKLSERQVRTCLDRLKEMEILTIKSTSRYSIYTIVKYNEYQESDQQATSQTPADDQQATSRRPADDQQATTKQTHKHINTEEKNNTPMALLASLKISETVAKDFVSLRNRLKAPITETAIAGIQREASKAGLSLEDALTMCCERSWRGFKADWVTASMPQAVDSDIAKMLKLTQGAL